MSQVDNEDALSWLVIGDYDDNGKGGQQAVAAKMNEIASKEEMSFIINTGDNFLDVGQSNPDRNWGRIYQT